MNDSQEVVPSSRLLACWESEMDSERNDDRSFRMSARLGSDTATGPFVLDAFDICEIVKVWNGGKKYKNSIWAQGIYNSKYERHGRYSAPRKCFFLCSAAVTMSFCDQIPILRLLFRQHPKTKKKSSSAEIQKSRYVAYKQKTCHQGNITWPLLQSSQTP